MLRYKADLEAQKQEQEYLSDVQMEIELLDEDDKVQYKIGDTFVFLPQEEAVERLEQDTETTNSVIEKLEDQINDIEGQMSELKKALYAKFGNAINLEYDN